MMKGSVVPNVLKCCILTQIYNFETNQWSRMPDLQPHRSKHECMKYKDGVLLAGGMENTDNYTGGYYRKDVEFFNLTSSAWQKFPPLNHGRAEHVLVPVNGHPTVIGGATSWDDKEVSEKLYGRWLPWIKHNNDTRFMSAVKISDNL